MPAGKRMLFGDGRQRYAQLGLVDGNGCFVIMLDADTYVKYLRFSDEADYIGQLEEEIAGLRESAGRMRRRMTDLERLVRDMHYDLPKSNRKVYEARMENLEVPGWES